MESILVTAQMAVNKAAKCSRLHSRHAEKEREKFFKRPRPKWAAQGVGG